jgi:excisionase family DNA binding protein
MIALLWLAAVMRLSSVSALPHWRTIPEVARHAGVSAWTVREEIRRGNLTARRIGRLLRVLDDEVGRWMRAGS